MIKLNIAMLFFVLGGISLFAQSASLSGTITDQVTGAPIPFATVMVVEGEVQLGGTASDFDGNFTIDYLPPGQHRIKARAVGYTPMTSEIMDFLAGETLEIDISLGTKTQSLEWNFPSDMPIAGVAQTPPHPLYRPATR